MPTPSRLTIRQRAIDRRLAQDIVRLLPTPPKRTERLPALAPVPALPGRGVGLPFGGVTAGIASPLTEPDYAVREYHDEIILTSSDGVFTIEVQPLAAIELLDATAAPVRIEFAAPPAPPP